MSMRVRSQTIQRAKEGSIYRHLETGKCHQVRSSELSVFKCGRPISFTYEESGPPEQTKDACKTCFGEKRS
eukprot:12422466-Karenia_brevis.AAC.1